MSNLDYCSDALWRLNNTQNYSGAARKYEETMTPAVVSSDQALYVTEAV